MNSYFDDYNGEIIEEREEIGPVKRFFFTCSGAYMKILEITPSEHNKYIGIGATIFLTGCLAVISGSFAIFTIVPHPVVAVLFGLLWGALIFNLDRYIVSSMRKEGKFRHEFLMALPRLCLAVLISIVITKPIEVELFRNQISSELFAYTSDLQLEAEMKLDKKLGLDSVRREIILLDSMRLQYKKAKESRPASYSFEEITEDYEEAKSDYEKTVAINQPRIRANERQNKEIWKNHARKIYDEVDGEKVFKRWALDPRYQSRSLRLLRTNQMLTAEIAEKKKLLESLENSRRNTQEEYQEGVNEELDMIKAKLAELTTLKRERDSLRKIELPQALQKAEKYGVGFPAKIEALERLKEQSTSIWWISNLIVLLFILLETSPVFVKMIIKRGPYDYILSRIEHQKKISALQSISDMNYDLNRSLRKYNGNHVSTDVYVKDDN